MLFQQIAQPVNAMLLIIYYNCSDHTSQKLNSKGNFTSVRIPSSRSVNLIVAFDFFSMFFTSDLNVSDFSLPMPLSSTTQLSISPSFYINKNFPFVIFFS